MFYHSWCGLDFLVVIYSCPKWFSNPDSSPTSFAQLTNDRAQRLTDMNYKNLLLQKYECVQSCRRNDATPDRCSRAQPFHRPIRHRSTACAGYYSECSRPFWWYPRRHPTAYWHRNCSRHHPETDAQIQFATPAVRPRVFTKGCWLVRLWKVRRPSNCFSLQRGSGLIISSEKWSILRIVLASIRCTKWPVVRASKKHVPTLTRSWLVTFNRSVVKASPLSLIVVSWFIMADMI